MAPPTAGALEAPADVDVSVVSLRLDRLEVFATDDVEAGQVDGAGRDTEVSHMVGRGAAHTPVHAPCNHGNGQQPEFKYLSGYCCDWQLHYCETSCLLFIQRSVRGKNMTDN